MRRTDRSSESDAYINIGMEQEIFIPETLRFVATINTDQTTETLSPNPFAEIVVMNGTDTNNYDMLSIIFNILE